jgi:hypothetical protein
MRNPLALKADLVASGVTIAAGLDESLGVTDPATDAVDVALTAGLTASVPVLRDVDGTSAYRLCAEAGRVYLERPEGLDDEPRRIAVDARPAPRFYATLTSRGTPMHRIAERRGRILVVTPLGRCGYSIVGRPCTFCIEGGRSGTAPGAAATPGEIVEVVTAAVREGPVDVVLFNTDSAEGDDAGMALLGPYVQAVRRHVPVLVAAHLHPPRTAAWVDRSYALGLDAISYGLEIFDPNVFGRLCVGRARYIGRDRYLEMLARAATVFPRGAVWSELVVGVEPVERTLAGIEALATMGVVPVLAIPRGPHGLRRRPAPDDLSRLVTRLAEATAAHEVPTTWIRELGASIAPADVHFLVGTDGAAGARLAVRGAHLRSRVRRWLRVRRVEADA